MRNVIKRDHVRVDEPERTRRVAACAAESASAAPAGPHARLVELDGGVQALEFTCSCGEVSLIEIQCEKKP